MSNDDEARVLGRRGARDVTDDEIRRVAGHGAMVPTRLTEFLTGTASNPDKHFDE